jgi:FkbM family methyltransferase
VKVPFVPAIISPKIESPLRGNRYEARECTAVRRMLRPGDRVLELGAGVGLLSTVAALVRGIESVTTVEANPGLIPLIHETHRLNGVQNVTVMNGVAASEDGPDIDFYLRPDFWASSMEPASRPYDSVAKLPQVGVRALVEKLRPTVIICDIEGGELGLFDAVDLSSVRALVIELHPKVYGKTGLERIGRVLKAKGLAVPDGAQAASVRILHREVPIPAAPITPLRTVLIAEIGADAPWLLEWLAWHKAAGADAVVAFNRGNDAATTAMLDRLGAMGHLQHLPHPDLAGPDTDWLAFARHLPVVRQAEYVLPLGVDEFLNIRIGDHTLSALYQRLGSFDVLSAAQVVHGANQRDGFKPDWLTARLPRHQKTTPGKPKAMRLARSLVRLSAQVEALGAHRPRLRAGAKPVWLDGSGRPMTALAQHVGQTQLDCRGASDLLRIERFPLRDLDSYLASVDGTADTMAGRRALKTFWLESNKNDEDTADYAVMLAAARSWHDANLRPDEPLMALQDAACLTHANRLASMSLDPGFQRRRIWALTEAW